MTFVVRDTIFDEYCSCGKQIRECEVWQKIVRIWLSKNAVSYDQYKILQNKYERNKVFLTTIINMFFPSNDFNLYIASTKKLFDAIHEVTAAEVIIDSSKSPQRIAVLRKIVDLKVIHLCRNFSGVLNTGKRKSIKDIKAGVEFEKKPSRTAKKLFDWILTNGLVSFFGLFSKMYILKYQDYISDLDILSKIDDRFSKIHERAPYQAPHMLAGNALRLRGPLTINTHLGFRYENLTKNQKRFSYLVDKIFWFWC